MRTALSAPRARTRYCRSEGKPLRSSCTTPHIARLSQKQALGCLLPADALQKQDYRTDQNRRN